MVLAKLLAHDQQLSTLKLNDCSISHDGYTCYDYSLGLNTIFILVKIHLGLKDIFHSLTTNTALKLLELKGNNIQGTSIEYLAKLIRHNTSIRSLSLEWNTIGLMDTNSFPLFCESLTINKSLQDLDLRNNQISHNGTLELCAALEKNTTLKILGRKNSCRLNS
jgi:Ran GTPase-activating protein (RanGAP) involved in mRNA processing and transport